MKNSVTLNTNEILESNPTYNNVNMKNIIKTNILTDYANGIKNADIEVFPSNLVDLNGQVVKTWQNGEILKVGDKIKILGKDNDSYIKDKDNNPIYFKVVDRKVSYEGQVILSLKLKQIKKVGN